MPKPIKPAGDKLATAFEKQPSKSRPSLWEGPGGAGPNGGISFSMLREFLRCRERFRVRYVEGWRTPDQFSHRMDYGTFHHRCEQALAAVGPGEESGWRDALRDEADKFRRKYPLAQKEITHWEEVCAAQFPVYVEYWSQHEQVKNRTPLLQEQVFDVPYTLPSGRTVRLRGRWDAVDLIGRGKTAAVYLFETKTKGDIDPELLQRQLTQDLQTMLYLVSLGEYKTMPDRPGESDNLYRHPIAGVRYNVVRRPLSGGKGSIVRGKPTEGAKCPKCKGEPGNTACPKCGGAGRVGGKPEEPAAEFYARLQQAIRDNADHFFTRFQVEVGPHDVKRFREQCLDPTLMQLVNWYDGIVDCTEGGYDPFTVSNPVTDEHGWHYRTPHGIGGPLDDYPPDEIDEYINNRSTVGLERADRLFRELD